MSIAVIIVNWNSGNMLAQCLQCLENQTLKPDKVMVIDNASSDNSIEVTKKYTNVTVRKLKNNLGFAGANNLALKECDSEYVALLNPDAFPEPDWLQNLHSAVVNSIDVVAFGSRQLRYSDPEILDGTGDVYHISGRVWRNGYGKRQSVGDLIAREIFSPCAAAALYCRQAILDIGGFDEDFFSYVEDIDLGFRLRLMGYKAMYVPDAVVRHVGSATTGGPRSEFALYYGHRNMVWAFIKNMPGLLLWLLLPLHIMFNIIVVIIYTTRGYGRIIVKSKLNAIKGFRTIAVKRRHIQKKRTATIKDIWCMLNKSI
ncbi:glycosyltransferase family 2 protein [Alicyclobacillus tolerans]|uniref:glycosyltransferase family 2 protein n=1 Tax=Alicyclobacillus tolerans TaxID=90970 RepID=UPI001F2A825C|nr:glycosyltransferase family 2 protein [Alicyclobacillus tolerans]MCF8567863.1 glycosyltransferase family 2 protein [Alicyclobacillus tolerans]